jgi:hypothetical protein
LIIDSCCRESEETETKAIEALTVALANKAATDPLAAVPLALLLRKVKLGETAPVAH